MKEDKKGLDSSHPRRLPPPKTIDVDFKPISNMAKLWISVRSVSYGKILLAFLALMFGLAVLFAAFGSFAIGVDIAIPFVVPHLTRDVAFVSVLLILALIVALALFFYKADIATGLKTRNGKLLAATVGLALLSAVVGSLVYFELIDPMNLLYYGVPGLALCFIAALVLTNWTSVSNFFASAFTSQATKVLTKVAAVIGVIAGLCFAVHWAAVQNQYLTFRNAVALVIVLALTGWVIYLFHKQIWKGMTTKNFGIIALLAGVGVALYFFVWPTFPRTAAVLYVGLILFLVWLWQRKTINAKFRKDWDNYWERRRVKRDERNKKLEEAGEETTGLNAWFKRHLVGVAGKSGASAIAAVGLLGLAFSILIDSVIVGFPSLYLLFLGGRNLIYIYSGNFNDLQVLQSLRLWVMPIISGLALLVEGFLVLGHIANLQK